mmetsp:Transcript_39274/g.118719  ORF Transcript_39274/g.118719 Transcript_39274/m.118719 type:complete len:203 (-) Transcript_39274:1249-1857(-)
MGHRAFRRGGHRCRRRSGRVADAAPGGAAEDRHRGAAILGRRHAGVQLRGAHPGPLRPLVRVEDRHVRDGDCQRVRRDHGFLGEEVGIGRHAGGRHTRDHVRHGRPSAQVDHARRGRVPPARRPRARPLGEAVHPGRAGCVQVGVSRHVRVHLVDVLDPRLEQAHDHQQFHEFGPRLHVFLRLLRRLDGLVPRRPRAEGTGA